MRELHGVTLLKTAPFKQYALLFDKLYVGAAERLFSGEMSLKRHPNLTEPMADLQFLRSIDFARPLPEAHLSREFSEVLDDMFTTRTIPRLNVRYSEDLAIRRIAVAMQTPEVNVVPICQREIPFMEGENEAAGEVFKIGLSALPMPAADAAWEDVLSFRSEVKDKLWNFRRFLQTLATKQQSATEIRDDIQWCLHEYAEAMKKRHMKIVQGALWACVIPAADIMFNFPGNHIASIASAAVAISKIRIEILEGEMKAPGRECAYVFEARKRFCKP